MQNWTGGATQIHINPAYTLPYRDLAASYICAWMVKDDEYESGPAINAKDNLHGDLRDSSLCPAP